ncbi:MAG: hypothetical protein AAGF47_03775 [Planctomycetota bacterium]
MADINTAHARSFANGGTVQIGADTIVNIGPGGGGFRFTAATRQRMRDAGTNQGVLRRVPEGAQRRGTLSMSLRFTGDVEVQGSLYDLWARDSDDAFTVEHDVVVTVFNSPTDTTGDRFTFAGCFLAEGLDYESSDGNNDGDMLSLQLEHQSMRPIASAVS